MDQAEGGWLTGRLVGPPGAANLLFFITVDWNLDSSCHFFGITYQSVSICMCVYQSKLLSHNSTAFTQLSMICEFLSLLTTETCPLNVSYEESTCSKQGLQG
jgi:hypothetical protein